MSPAVVRTMSAVRGLVARERGQVLPLTALFMIVLLGFAALAVDVSRAYADLRLYRATADAAALAGAQDLQVPGTRDVTTAEYAAARSHAIESVEARFGTTSTCTLTGNRSNCTLVGQPYTFAVTTPVAPGGCAACDPDRSVQVNFNHPTFGLTFARVMGQTTWRLAVTSVAGLDFGKAYAIVTLRPPSSTSISGVRDIAINGGSIVNVDRGDVGTNANMTYSGSGSILTLDSGFGMFYFDPANAPLWGSNPTAERLGALIADPGYPIPSRGTSPPAGAEDVAGCPAIAATIYANAQYAPSVPVAAGVPDMTKIHCYTRGVFPSGIDVPNGELAILEPGLYFFDDELDVQGSLIGGYTPNSEGVALVFREGEGTEFKNRTSGGSSSLQQIVALNAGDKFQNSAGREATAARDYAGGFVQTNTTPPKMMTVIVQRDSRCRPVLPFPSSCSNMVENQNKAIDLSGGSRLYLAGVQYAPSDNVTMSGNTSAEGYVGQVWAWTLVYTGGGIVNQEGDPSSGPGVLRLDAACTAPGTPCMP